MKKIRKGRYLLRMRMRLFRRGIQNKIPPKNVDEVVQEEMKRGDSS
jgi:hypothetical protein